jgi:hypothetical protein
MTERVPHLNEFRKSWGLVLEVRLSALSERTRKILLQRATDSIRRHNEIIAHLVVVMDTLQRKPLSYEEVQYWQRRGGQWTGE